MLPGSDRATDALVTADHQCVSLAADASATMRLSMEPDRVRDGQAEGTVQLRLEAAAGQGNVDLEIPMSADLVRPVDQGRRLGLVLALMGLALAVPLLLLFGANYLVFGRFTLRRGSRLAAIPVSITPAGLRRMSGGALVEPEDMRNIPLSKDVGKVDLTIPRTQLRLRSRRILDVRDPQGGVESADRRMLVATTGVGVATGKGRREAPVELGTVNAAFVVVTPSSSAAEAQGRLVVVVPPGVTADEADRLAQPLTTWDGWRELLEANAEESSGPGRSGPSPTTEQGAAPPLDDLPPPLWPAGATAGTGARGAPAAPVWHPPPGPLAATDDQGLPPLPDFLK
jgi:hypothetical protein